jgi:hypothetical protein
LDEDEIAHEKMVGIIIVVVAMTLPRTKWMQEQDEGVGMIWRVIDKTMEVWERFVYRPIPVGMQYSQGPSMVGSGCLGGRCLVLSFFWTWRPSSRQDGP